jgi:hypothetical protein
MGNFQQSIINIKLTGKNQPSPRKIVKEEYIDPLDQLIGLPSRASKTSNYNDLPKVNMIRVDSEMM